MNRRHVKTALYTLFFISALVSLTSHAQGTDDSFTPEQLYRTPLFARVTARIDYLMPELDPTPIAACVASQSRDLDACDPNADKE